MANFEVTLLVVRVYVRFLKRYGKIDLTQFKEASKSSNLKH